MNVVGYNECMADVFISYAREDRAVAAALAEVISREGWTVWWDREIQVGRSFSELIERELEAAWSVIVLWSRTSTKSQWVLAEASEGAAKQILVPVRIEDVRPPLEFRRLHTADVLDWQSVPNAGLNDCLSALKALLGRPTGIPHVALSPRSHMESAFVHDQHPNPVGQAEAWPRVDKPQQVGIGTESNNLSAVAAGKRPTRRGNLALAVAVIMLILWFMGFSLHIGGALINLLLVVALGILIFKLVAAIARGNTAA